MSDEVIRWLLTGGGGVLLAVVVRRADSWLDKRSDRAAEVRVREAQQEERGRERQQDERHETDVRARDQLARRHLETYCWPNRQKLINATGVDPGEPPPLIP